MTAPRPISTPSPTSSEAASQSASASNARPRNDRARPARRDNPDAPQPKPLRSRERQPRTYTTPDLPPRRRRPRQSEEPSAAQPTLEELDRWDEEWRDEWDRGDVDDSAAYDDELDVAEQSRDIEWLLDALDAMDDTGNDDDAFDWEES